MDATSHNPAVAALRPTLVRAAVLAGLWIGYYWLLHALADSKGDANIGAGLIGFGLMVLAAGVWAFLDGRRLSPDVGVPVWIVTPVLTAMLASLNRWAAETDAGERPPASDLVGSVVFLTVLMAGPALLALVAGRAARGTAAQ